MVIQYLNDNIFLGLFLREVSKMNNTTQHNTTQHNTTQHNLDHLGQGLFVKFFLKSLLIFKELVDSFSVIKGGVSFD